MNLVLPEEGTFGTPLAEYAPPVDGALDLRVRRYERAKARSLQMLTYIRGLLAETSRDSPHYAQLVRQAQRLRACGTWLCFHYYYGWPKGVFEDEYRLVQANFCNQHLLCNACAIRRAVVKMRAYFERFEYLMAQQPFLTPHLITLTVKNGPDVLERFEHLRKCFRTLQQRRRNYLTRPHCNRYTEFAKVTAGVGGYEFTYNRHRRDHHPHIHLIGLVNGRLHQLRMVEAWRSIAKDSFIVDVRPFSTPAEPIRAFQEVFKYALKFSQLPIPLNYQVAEQLQGCRLLVSFGDFWGTKVPEKLTDDPLEQDYVEYLYEWIDREYRLQGVRQVERE